MYWFFDRNGQTHWIWDKKTWSKEGVFRHFKGFGQYNKSITFAIEMEKHIDFAMKGLGQIFERFVQYIKMHSFCGRKGKSIDFAITLFW